MPWRPRKYTAVVVIDTKTMDVECVYVHMRLAEATRAFLRTIIQQYDQRYSDARDDIDQCLDRYEFIETNRVIYKK